MVDTIAGDASTTRTISVGGSVTSAVDTIGDHDWFRITLTAGQELTISLNGVTLSDPYLRIRDSAGNIVSIGDRVLENDDYGSLNSQISFQVTQSGTYYIDVAAWANPADPGATYPGVTGDYQLNVSTFQTPPVWNNDQIANQLTSGYWGGEIQRFALDQSRQLTYNIDGLTAQGQHLAVQALQTWSQITGITFVPSSSPDAQIEFADDDPEGGAFTESFYDQSGNITSSDVNVDVSWLQGDFTVGGYTYQAYLHEIGHALGLGHAGNYNTAADYPYDALSQNDAWSTSVMSYFSQIDSSYFSGQGFTYANLVTPMVADILAMQQLYGLSSTTRSGNTIYGFNSNAGSPFDASALTNVAFTIFDTGGTDTLDYSQYAFNQTINLNPETFSSIGGERGNVSIARGTIIENAIGGSFKDTIIGNSVANVLTGSGGVDTLTGGLSNDTFQDTKSGLNGDTITDFSVGDKIVFADATLAGFTFNLTGNTLNYSGGSMTLSAPLYGTIVASAAAGGGVQLTIIPPVDAHSDVNGDGRSDLLLRNDNGTITEWLGQANGGFFSNHAVAAYALSTAWHVEAIADFNGDGRDDLFLQNDNGAVTDWLGAANGSFFSNHVNASYVLPSDWHVADSGDFNGDGLDDVLLRNNNGSITEWLGQANGGFFSNQAVAAYALDNAWHVDGIGDFNGDGRDDVLLRHDNGAVTDWLGQANGSFFSNHAAASYALPTGWHIAGVGDFNGDGRDDALLRNDNGSITEWIGTPNGGFFSNHEIAAYALSNTWHVDTIGDFNGDGRDDVLLRNDNGAVTNWLGQVNGSFFSNHAAASYALPSAWHVQSDGLWV